MYDAVTPQNLNNTQYQVVAFYCGGDTPHVWSHAELESAPQRYRLPIWVRSNPGTASMATQEAQEFVSQLRFLGCPNGVTVALDYETARNQAYLDAFCTVMWNAGRWKVMLYGSLSTVKANTDPSGGYWIAAWDNLEDFPDGSVAHQFMNHPNYDSSVISDSVVLWDTKPVISSFKRSDKGHDSMFLTDPAKPFYLPIEPVGTTAHPVGPFHYGPAWLNLAPQGSGTLIVEWNVNGKWETGFSNHVDAGGLVVLAVPESGPRIVRISCQAEIVGYVAASQVN